MSYECLLDMEIHTGLMLVLQGNKNQVGILPKE
jgi:hypothetical protein